MGNLMCAGREGIKLFHLRHDHEQGSQERGRLNLDLPLLAAGFDQVRPQEHEGLAAGVELHDAAEKAGHGRQEARTYVIFPAPEPVDPDGLWRDLSAVGMAITESTDSQGHCRLEVRYYILSVPLSAKRFADCQRALETSQRGALENQPF